MTNVAAGDPKSPAPQLFIPAGWKGEGQPPLYTAAQVAALTAPPAQPAAPQGVAYAELDDAFESWLEDQDVDRLSDGYESWLNSVRSCWDSALRASHGQAPAGAAILCWVNEDELPEGLTQEAYSALFPHSKVDVVRMFPVFGPTAQAAPAGDLPEEQTQPWYDLAWRHGARRHTSFDGDELTELSFSPTQFDAFCADLAPAAGAVAGPGEVAALQRALAFWLPHVPAEDHPMLHRIASDATLLVGYEGGNEPDAFTLGYITLQDGAAAPTPAAQADSQPAPVREGEREAFKAVHRHLELDEVPDAWGRPMFKHSHVEASWLGWIARAARAPADSVLEDAALATLFTTPYQRGEMAGDGKPCNNDHDPDCRWPDCICRHREARFDAARKQGAKHD